MNSPAGFAGSSARSRLLPMSVPFRFFGAAVFFHLLAWVLIAVYGGDLAAYTGGPGPILAALHAITLGVFAMTAAGASLQLLPVATRQPVRSIAAAKWVWNLLTPGTIVFVVGAAAYQPQIMEIGALVAGAGLVLHAWLLFENLRRAQGLRSAIAHGWVALVAFVLTVASGIALAAGYVHGFAFTGSFAMDRMVLAAAHMLLATYGYMGLLALGFSYFLLPMFALSEAPSRRSAHASLALGVLALLAAALALMWRASGTWLALTAVIGLAAALWHILPMERALHRRARGATDRAFLLVRLSWGLLLASLAAGFAVAIEVLPGNGLSVFVILIVPGWLLTFVLAVLQRIAPFLATVHVAGTGKRAPLPSALAPRRILDVHGILHVTALAGLLAGVVLDMPAIVRLGAGLGVAAAATYGAFFVILLFRFGRARVTGTAASSGSPNS